MAFFADKNGMGTDDCHSAEEKLLDLYLGSGYGSSISIRVGIMLISFPHRKAGGKAVNF